MWELFTEIFKTLNPKSWPARFSLLKSWKQLFVIVSTILLILWALVVAGHFSKIGVSIGPTASQNQWSVPLRLFNPLSVLGAGLLLFSVYFMATATTGKKREKPEQLEEVRESVYPEKLTVHVVLPISGDGDTVGDGLLQAAGFMLGEKCFSEYINPLDVKDHQNNQIDPNCAVNKLDEILEKHRNDNEPICIVYTMSDVCDDVKKAFYERCKDDLSLRERTSIIFTVASRLDRPCDGKNIFQHFVTGDIEAEALIAHCESAPVWRQRFEAIVLADPSEDYPEQTAGKIVSELQSEGFKARKCAIDREGGLPNDVLELIEKSNKEKEIKPIIIVIAYDMTLFNVIENLDKQGYSGQLVATTTLSVPDWQDYIRNKLELKFDVWFTCIKNFDITKKPASYFANRLKQYKIKFKEVISNSNFYPMGYTEAEKMFIDREQQIYKNIKPNYISAFCFDSIRLFAQMKESNKSKLSDILYSYTYSKCSNFCPFKGLTYHRDGYTIVPLSSKAKL